MQVTEVQEQPMFDNVCIYTKLQSYTLLHKVKWNKQNKIKKHK